MGEALLGSGAEIYRAEDTLRRMGYAYGARDMNVFVIPSSIVITMEMPEGGTLTQTRRVRTANANDFTRLDDINELSRDYCSHPFPVEELRNRLEAITAQHVFFLLRRECQRRCGCGTGRTFGLVSVGLFCTDLHERYGLYLSCLLPDGASG